MFVLKIKWSLFLYFERQAGRIQNKKIIYYNIMFYLNFIFNNKFRKQYKTPLRIKNKILITNGSVTQ